MIHILPQYVHLRSAPGDKTFITYFWDLFRPPYQISGINNGGIIPNFASKVRALSPTENLSQKSHYIQCRFDQLNEVVEA